MLIKLSDHQVKLLTGANTPGNTDLTVWSLPNTQPGSYRSLYRYGLITTPGWIKDQSAPRLTDSGKDVAWILAKNPDARTFDVGDDTIPEDYRPVPRALGENQRHALKTLADPRWDGRWYPGAGWVWTNMSTTVRLLDSLVKRGLATKEIRRYERIPEDYPYYEITEKGRETARTV